MNIIKRLLVLISLILVSITGVILLSCIVNAQNTGPLGLSVSPQIFELDVFPGETRNEKIIVGNLSKVALPILVRTTDFTAEENSGEMLFDESSQDPSFASRFWFKVEHPNLILEPEEKRSIEFSIEVPKNAEPGGHYAVMLFEPQLPSFYFREGQARAIPVVGVLFLISVKTFALEPTIQQKLEVVEFSLPKEERIATLENFFSVVQRSYQRLSASIGLAYAAEMEIEVVKKTPSSFILKIKNNDIYHIKPFGKVLIYNLFGKKVKEIEIPRQTILPGKTRQFPVEFSQEVPERLKWLPASISNFFVQNFFIGRYRAVLELPETDMCSLVFFAFPWKFWLPFTGLIFLLIFFVVKYRRRIKLAIKTLIYTNKTPNY